MSRIIISFCFVFASIWSYGQANIVPNPGFENYLDVPDHWYYNGEHFTEIVQFWSSPTPASPDAYGNKINIPRHWKDKGFGNLRAHSGENMIGVTIFGCEGGKPHCREYIQIRLAEAMVPEQEYEISFWVAHLESSCYANNLGAVLSKNEIHDELDVLLVNVPQVNEKDIVSPPYSGWTQLSYRIRVYEAFEFLTIGNFFSDEHTLIAKSPSSDFDFAYYYLDDISVVKLEPILPSPMEKDLLAEMDLKEGKKVILENIYFDYDRADFLNRSFEQLNALLKLLKSKTQLVIEIHGHTDNTGSDDYNQNLSFERAKAVVDFLVQRGISEHRLTYKGFGSSQPIENNETFAGRKRNRRVEFLILESSQSH